MSGWWSHTTVTVQNWEYWALGLGVAVACILLIISRLVPNEKRASAEEDEGAL